MIYKQWQAPSKIFSTWMTKNIILSGSTREVKHLEQHERAWIIYDGMIEIGKQINTVLNKGASQIN